MDHSDHEEFETAESGTSKTTPKQCSALRKNGHVMIKDHPCRIVEMSTSKTGKHGHAKVHLVGIDIFTNKKYEDLCPSTHNMMVPTVKKTDYTFVCDEGDGFVVVMDSKGDQRSDLRVPENPELLEEMKRRIDVEGSFLVTVQSACDMEAIIGFKTLSE